MYLRHFNWVDMANKAWSQVEEHHQHHSWKRKLLLAMLRYAILNACHAYARKEGLNFPQYRTKLARALIDESH